MAGRLFALLSGVNDYTPNVGSLSGCLNDVAAYETYLKENVDPAALQLEVLRDSQVTRKGLIDAFREHLCQAGPDDVALFQFAGHGARWKSAQAFKQFYPDGYDEGMIVWDSRREPDKPGSYDFADKELAVLVAEVARNNPHILVILDCCHSGSGTRSADDFSQLNVRKSHTIEVERPLESYIDGYYQRLADRGEVLYTPTSRHVLLAACERKKPAFEGLNKRGIFSEALIEGLNKCGGQINYADLFVRLRSIVKRRAYNQTPQFETYQGFNARAGFLGCQLKTTGRTRFHVDFDMHAGWLVECGAIQGIVGRQDQAVEFALYSDVGDEEPIGTATATNIGLAKSGIELKFESARDKSYFAELSSLPAAPMHVGLQGEQGGLTAIKNWMDGATNQFFDFEFIEDAKAARRCDYQVIAEDIEGHGPCLLIRDNRSGTLVRGFKGYNELAAASIVKLLVQICTWESMLELQNNDNKADTNRVPFSFVEIGEGGKEIVHQGSRIVLDFADDDSVVTGKLVANNTTSQDLYTMLVHFSDGYGMAIRDVDEFPPAKTAKTIPFAGDPELELFMDADGPARITERLMLIVSNKPIDDFLVAGGSDDGSGEILEAIETGQIVEPLQGRGIRTGKKKIKDIDWFTQTIELELVRSAGKLAASDTELSAGSIRIKGHPSFKANASLTAMPVGARSADASADFVRALSSANLSLMNFAKTRGENLSVLELSDIENPSVLTGHPLELEIDAGLAEGESLLPLAFDGEHILPVGESFQDEQGKTRIRIDEIPDIPDNRRSVFASLKLYFFKSTLKLKNVNKLEHVTYRDDGATVFGGDDLAGKVAAAQRIVIMVHGILGSGSAMATGLHPAKHPAFAKDLSDDGTLVLAYEYENLNTPIEATAADLQAQLHAIGISAGTAKPVTIVAHSIGGLVARHMIESGKGNKFISHLVMCGTPNGGSPIGKIGTARTVLKILSGLAVNVFPPAAAVSGFALAWLLKAQSLTKTMEQLDPASDFLKNLNASADPGVCYTMFAGNILESPESDDWVNRLLVKLGGSSLATSCFKGADHDLLVDSGSALAVSRTREPAPAIRTLGCHHLDYFNGDLTLELF